MGQVQPQGAAWWKTTINNVLSRLKALEVTVPIAGDSTGLIQTLFTTSSEDYVVDGLSITKVGPINCFGIPFSSTPPPDGSPSQGTNVLVIASCQVGLDTTLTAIGGIIGVQVDGGGTVDPVSGPGIYGMAIAQAGLGGVAMSVCGARAIMVLSPEDTQGLSQHTFEMVYKSTFGQPVHFEARTLAVIPQ